MKKLIEKKLEVQTRHTEWIGRTISEAEHTQVKLFCLFIEKPELGTTLVNNYGLLDKNDKSAWKPMDESDIDTLLVAARSAYREATDDPDEFDEFVKRPRLCCLMPSPSDWLIARE